MIVSDESDDNGEAYVGDSEGKGEEIRRAKKRSLVVILVMMS